MTRSEFQTFSARMDSLPLATGFVQAFCDQQRVAPESALRLTLIVEELFTNAIQHGHGGDNDAPVRIQVGVDAAQLLLCFEDSAPPFDPLQYLKHSAPDPDMERDRPGGWGLHLVAQMSERFDYVHAEGWNRLQLALRL